MMGRGDLFTVDYGSTMFFRLLFHGPFVERYSIHRLKHNIPRETRETLLQCVDGHQGSPREHHVGVAQVGYTPGRPPMTGYPGRGLMYLPLQLHMSDTRILVLTSCRSQLER